MLVQERSTAASPDGRARRQCNTPASVRLHARVAGWTALLRLPRGFYSLNLLGCDLSYDSYALLRLHVGELQASKVKSPEEEAVAEKRRSAAVLMREEKRAAREEKRAAREESVAEQSDDEAAA